MALTRDARERSRRRRTKSSTGPELRRAEQEWLSRQLHDDLGPSLCAAGLQLSLLRSESGEIPQHCAQVLDGVQSILDQAVDQVRLLSYAVCPANAAQCNLRDMAPMVARAFHASVPEFEAAPPAEGAAAVEFTAQLLDCLLLVSQAGGKLETKVILQATSVSLDASGRLGDLLSPVSGRKLKHWETTLTERPRLRRTTMTWKLRASME